MRFIRLLLRKINSNDRQRNRYQNQCCRYLCSSNKIPKTGNIHLDHLSNIKDNHIKNIPKRTDFVKIKTSEIETRDIANQPAARLPQIPDRTLNQAVYHLY